MDKAVVSCTLCGCEWHDCCRLKHPNAMSTNDVLESERGMVAYRECSNDPIFLFQTKDYGTSEADYSAMEDLGWHCDEGWYVSKDEDADKVTTEMMADHDIGTLHWDTQKVFLHREEARRYGERRPYAWGDEGEGWRIFCVNAEGELAQTISGTGNWKGDPKFNQRLSEREAGMEPDGPR